jgi:hypothetical protein
MYVFFMGSSSPQQLHINCTPALSALQTIDPICPPHREKNSASCRLSLSVGSLTLSCTPHRVITASRWSTHSARTHVAPCRALSRLGGLPSDPLVPSLTFTKRAMIPAAAAVAVAAAQHHPACSLHLAGAMASGQVPSHIVTEDLTGTCWRDDLWLGAFGLHHGNVLDYFSLSPFYDRACANERGFLAGKPRAQPP